MASKQFNSVDGYSIGNATVVVDANANVTAAALTANGNVSFTGANVSLGAVGNLKITGGSSGLYLQTDGSGNLSWQAVSVSTASISNGNSNVNIPAANGNIQVSVAGVANVITFANTNAFRGVYGLTGAISQANTAPSSPQNGDQWYNTFNGILFEYLDDGTSSQWVDISSLPLPNISTVNASAVLNNVQSAGTYYPAFISSTANGNYSLNSNTAFSANIANGALIATTFVGALSGAATSATTAGTVTTAAQPNITSVGTLTSLGVNGTVTAVAFTANTGVFTGNGSGLSAIAGANVTGTVSSATTAGTVTTAAQPNITSVGTLSSLAVTGNVTGGNLNTSGNVNASIMVDGGTGIYLAAGPSGYINFFTTGGDKATITDSGNIAASNLIANSTVFATTSNVSGNVNAGNVYANSGTIGASLLTGTLTTAAQPNVTSLGTLSSLSVTGNVAAGNLTTTGVLSVTGTGVSSIAGNLDMTSNTIINLATPTNPTDAATKQYVDDIAQGLHTHDSCNAATNTTLATISGGTVTYNNGASGVGANLTTTGSFTTIDGVTLSNGMRILVKNEANSAHNGIYDRTSTTVLTRSSDFDTPTEMAGGDFTFVTAGTLYDNTGWVMTDAVTTVGTSPVDWVQFSGAGTYTAGTGLTLTGTAFSVNASQSQITSVGTLTGLNSSGTITAPAFTANTGVFTGNGSGLSAIAGANVTGTVSSATTAGTVTTAAQPNITSTGTLTTLTVSGNTFLATSSGNVGIGTSSPQRPLHVFYNSSVVGAYSAIVQGAVGGYGAGMSFQSNVTGGSLTEMARITADGESAWNTTTSTQNAGLRFYTTSTGTITEKMRIANDGTTTLNVGGVSSTHQFLYNEDGAEIQLIDSTGAGPILIDNVSGLARFYKVGTGAMSIGTTGANYLQFVTNGSEGLRILSGGNVGIGNSAPTHKLSVTGTAAISSSLQVANITTGANTTAGSITGNWTLTAGSRLQATYADLAEKYVADDTYEPGTVLMFGGEQEVTLATTFDSTKVAGVVTTNPAYSMNSALEAEHVAEIALQGRVPCKVIGPVEKGDLMVSAINGHAIANNEARAGTIIGKALENFTGELGIIEVAVGRF